MKYKNKASLLADIENEWGRLWEMVDAVPPDLLQRKRGRAKGSLEWSVPDIMGHLYCWHRMLLGWYRDGERGKQPALPAIGFTWRQTKELNAVLYKEMSKESYKSIRRKLKLSHGRVLKITQSLSESQLMKPGYCTWTGKLGLVSYVGANTASHYRWAIKKIKQLTR